MLTSTPNNPTVRVRFEIFDGIRGHLLIGMLIAHFCFEQGLEWLHYFHHHKLIQLYDAEFFVLVAGLLVGHLWVKAYVTQKLKMKFVFARLRTIYKYYILSALPYLFFATLYGAPFLYSSVGVFGMQLGGWYSDILPIYFVCFMIIMPFALIPAINIPKLMFLVSAIIYAASQLTELNGFFGFSSAFVTFDIAAWQFLFVCALLIGQKGEQLYLVIKNSQPTPLAIAIATLTLFFVISRSYGLYSNPLDLSTQLTGHSPRMGLHPLFFLQVFAMSASIACVLIRNDPWLRPLHKVLHWYFGLTLIRNVGKYAIQMFVLHVYMLAIYKFAFVDSHDATKAIYAVLCIIAFISAPNLWMMCKKRLSLRKHYAVKNT